MTSTTDLAPISGPLAWRGDELSQTTDWVYVLSDAERTELEEVGRKFLNDNPDLRTVVADDYPLDVCVPAVAQWGADMDTGRGFVLVRGLRTHEYSDALSGAIFFVVGLHLGVPMWQNELGDLIDHVIATSDKTMDDPTAMPSRVRDKLVFHSDSSDIVSLMCLRPSKSGGASSLVSGKSSNAAGGYCCAIETISRKNSRFAGISTPTTSATHRGAPGTTARIAATAETSSHRTAYFSFSSPRRSSRRMNKKTRIAAAAARMFALTRDLLAPASCRAGAASRPGQAPRVRGTAWTRGRSCSAGRAHGSTS